MAYGTAAKVAALTPRYTSGGSFVDYSAGPPVVQATNPALATVTDWLDTISGFLDVYLAAAGFTVPVTQATCAKTLAGIAVSKTADLCHAANTAGRFASEKALQSGLDPLSMIQREIKTWVEQNTPGFIALGAAHSAADNREQTLVVGVIGLDIAEHGDGTSTVDE